MNEWMDGWRDGINIRNDDDGHGNHNRDNDRGIT